MKGIVKALIIGGVIIGIGIILLIVALSLNGWKLKGKVDFETVAYTCTGENTSLDVEIDAGAVRTEFYEGDKITVEYPKAEGFKSSVSEANGTLIIKTPKRIWYRNWFLTYDIPDTVIKIPQGSVMNVKFNIDAGSARLADGAYANVEVDIDAGTFNGGSITCNKLNCKVDAGTVKITSTTAEASFRCDIDAGTVNVGSLTAQSTDIDVSAGAVTVCFTGPETDYTISRHVSAGQCNLNNRTSDNANAKTINVDVSAGKVTASFTGN